MRNAHLLRRKRGSASAATIRPGRLRRRWCEADGLSREGYVRRRKQRGQRAEFPRRHAAGASRLRRASLRCRRSKPRRCCRTSAGGRQKNAASATPDLKHDAHRARRVHGRHGAWNQAHGIPGWRAASSRDPWWLLRQLFPPCARMLCRRQTSWRPHRFASATRAPAATAETFSGPDSCRKSSMASYFRRPPRAAAANAGRPVSLLAIPNCQAAILSFSHARALWAGMGWAT